MTPRTDEVDSEDFTDPVDARNAYRSLAINLETELDAIGEYLWPNQTGLPNQHRNALIAIKRREQLLQKQVETVTAELNQRLIDRTEAFGKRFSEQEAELKALRKSTTIHP